MSSYFFSLSLHCHSLGIFSPNAKMSPVKSKGKVNVELQKAEPPKNEHQLKISRQNVSKIKTTSKVPEGKQKQKGTSPTLESTSNTMNRKERVKAGQNKNMARSIGIKQRHKQDKNKLVKGRTADLKHRTDAEATNSTKKTARPSASKDSPSMVSTRPKNKRGSNVTESEEESESSAGSSVEVTDEKLSDDEKEEEQEQGNSEEAAEIQRSEQSSEEGTEASDTQRDTERTRNKGSDKELFETSHSDSEVKSESSSKEDEEDNGREAKIPETVISDGSEDKEIIQEDLHASLFTEKNSRRPREASRPPKRVEKSTFKMFRKTKADKQVEKAEKQKAKDEKQRLRKEAKQRAKEEKKNKKKSQKPVFSTEETQQLKRTSMSKDEASKCEIKHSNEAKNFKESDDPMEAETTDPDDDDEEEQLQDRPTLTKAINGQNRIILLKNKGKDLKPLLEREKQQETGGAIKGPQQKPLLGKIKMASLRNKANKILAKPDEESSEVGTLDEESSKGREHLIGRRKSITTLRRVSGWIQKKVPRGFNLKNKLSAWTKAIGISRWLSTRTIKQKQCPKKSKGNILKSRMAMRVASKKSLLSKSNENKMSKEKTWNVGKAGDGGEGVPTEEKDGEAKYAVVLPRMNKLGKPKTAEVAQAGHGSSTSSSTAGSPGEPTTTGPKPPKPGAKLVLPVKPDLSLLKSIKNPLSGGLTPGMDVTDKSPHSIGTMETSSNVEDRNRRPESENQSAVNILQTTRAKLDPSHISLNKISFSGGALGPIRAKGREPEREPAVVISRSTAQPCADAKPITEITGVRSLYEEEADREVAQLMGEEDIYGIGQSEIHWTGNPRMSGDPQVRTSNTRIYTTI